jgi:hypothetical protein
MVAQLPSTQDPGSLGGNVNTAVLQSSAFTSVPIAITTATFASAVTTTQNGEGSNTGAGKPTTAPTPFAANGKSGTRTGVVAGAAVGAAVGAAILTFLITFMFFRKKNEKYRRQEKDRSGNGGLSTYTEKALPKDPGGDAALAAPAWQKHIPQSADDKTIRSAVKTLFDQVELHVENFYRDSTVQMTDDLQTGLLRVDSPHLPESIVALLPRARSQTALIKHCLLSYIVASISIDDNSIQSLLPADYATLPHLARTAGQKRAGTFRFSISSLSSTGNLC